MNSSKHRISSFLLTCLLLLLSMPSALGQVNPYRVGSPHYWMAQGTLDLNAGKFQKAYENFQKALEGYSKLGDTPSVMKVLEVMGTYKFNMGEWDEAVRHYQRAMQIATDEKEESMLSSLLIDLICVNRRVGNIKSYNQCLHSLDSLYKTTQSAKVKFAYHLYWSNEYFSQREYSMGEYHLRQCSNVLPDLTFQEREEGKLMYYGSMLNSKSQQKKYNEAIEYSKKQIDQIKNIHGRNSDQQYQAYGKLCELYALNKDSVKAFACLDSLGRGIGHSYQDIELTAWFYVMRGDCYANFSNYQKALEYYGKAYNTLADRRAEESPVRLKCLWAMSESYFNLKRYDDSYRIYKEYLEDIGTIYGNTSGDYYQRLFALAYIEGKREHYDEAERLLRMSMERLLHITKDLWRYSTPSQRETYWKETLNNLSSSAAIYTQQDAMANELTTVCYNALLFSKALLLETEKTLVDIIRNEGNEEDIANYRELMALNSRLSFLRGNYEYNKQEIDSLNTVQRKKELLLSDKCESFREYDTYLDISYEKVKNSLKDNEILIDFSNYIVEDSITRYVAYVIKKNQSYPLLKSCFYQQQLDSLQDKAEGYLLYDHEIANDEAAKLIWNPLRKYVKEGCTVYYIPSGAIHGIALESLPLDDKTTLGQHYNFVRLTSAREIIREKQAKQSDNNAVLYGGLKYNLSAQKMEEESNAYDKTEFSWIERSLYGNKGFDDLRATKKEIEKIGLILKNNGFKVQTYSDAKGNAESFMALSSKAPRILHLATHGFYYTPEDAKNYDYLNGYTDAMSLSGLVFAGGNAAWLGKEKAKGVLGGILRASDIANLNLKGTDMAVLSACETAQGKVTAEGLYGLQRAFKKAGVGTIVMALCRINDAVTSEFMTTFYKCLTEKENNWDKRKAFERTKEIIRQKYHSPYYWAPFVMLD